VKGRAETGAEVDETFSYIMLSRRQPFLNGTSVFKKECRERKPRRRLRSYYGGRRRYENMCYHRNLQGVGRKGGPW
jgi:hypothetical protein